MTEEDKKGVEVYEMKKRANEIERHFQWRKEAYTNAVAEGVDPKIAYLYANICSNVILFGVEYDPALMEKAMKFCSPAFKAEVESLTQPQKKSKQSVDHITVKT